MMTPSDRSNLGSQLGIAARHWRARMDQRLAPLGLTHAKWVPLRYLSYAGGSLPQRTLVELTGIEGPSLVRVLDELERRGLVERRDSDADRRTKTVHLTDKAAPIIGEIVQRADGLREEVLDGISEEDIAVFRKVLAQISHNLGNLGS
jgi:MarR family transcriptional regulator for hemolysin